MCEKRTRKIKKGSQLTRLREARRLQRLQRLSSASTSDDNTTVSVQVSPCPAPTVDKAAQNRVILELAWKTIALMHKNRLIQQKIDDLKKETSEFVAIMNNPENRKRYIENIRLYGPMAQTQMVKLENVPIKLEPDV